MTIVLFKLFGGLSKFGRIPVRRCVRGGRLMFILRKSFIRVTIIALTAGFWGCAAPTPPPQSLSALANKSLAQIDGEIEISGLRAPVEIIRDGWGVPHIYAENDAAVNFSEEVQPSPSAP